MIGDIKWRKIKQTWSDMMRRCSFIESPDYKNYGARGIRVCERWALPQRVSRRHSTSGFLNFFEDMSPTWFEGATIDRIDNDSDYTLENCRWITKSENSTKGNRERECGGMQGKNHSDETKQKQSKARKLFWTDEKRRLMSSRLSGINNPNYKHGRCIREQ